MKLKSRLVIGFIIVIILPLALSFAVIMAFTNYRVHSIEHTYGITGIDYRIMVNPISAISKITESTFYQLSTVADEDTKQLENVEYLEKINEELKRVNSYLLIRRNESIAYTGSEDKEELISELPEYGEEEVSSENGFYIGGNYQMLVKQVDFAYTNGDEGSAFIVTNVRKAIPGIRLYITSVLIAIVLILSVTAGVIILWIYRGVAKPLSKMKTATQKIKDGNLEFEMETVETNDEIGQLSRDFEEMRKRLQDTAAERVENDERSKELISNISHDLKTPITAIKGYVEGIMDGVADTPEKMDRYIRTIYTKANEMDLLINELTLYSKIDANRIPYHFNSISAVDYFDDCATELQMEMEEKGISFTYENMVAPEIKMIVDAEQMKRVVNNIVSNSEKYMDKPEKNISLRVRDVRDYVQVEIEDNGKGIGEKELPYIFDRFYRTDASRNSETGGSGIGLSIVKKIMEEHGGKIWAASTEGQGTTMFFVIRKYQEVPRDE